MKKRIPFVAILLFLTYSIQAQSLWDADQLADVRQNTNLSFYATALEALKTDADKLLNAAPLSVIMKEQAPVSGDMHDYMSLARYYWPDPSKPNGLPYVRRDGLSNPELKKYDRNRLSTTARNVCTLALAWYFEGDEKYARKAAQLIRVWFLDKETAMNPHLEYAQVSRGHHGEKGRSFGLIDGYSFIELLEGVQLLEDSDSFSKKDSKRLRAWFRKLLDWMQTSEQGIKSGQAPNNHSVAYDAQIIAFALYCGKQDLARKTLEAFSEKRVFRQIEPDGRQPHELKRTQAFHYSQFNLSHFIDIYLMGEKAGMKLDNDISADGRSFYGAMDFLAQYAGKDSDEWPWQQTSNWERAQRNLCRDLYRAWLLNPDKKAYLRIFKANYDLRPTDRFNLLYVKPSDVDFLLHKTKNR